MNTLLLLGHITLFGSIFFSMFCRLNNTAETTLCHIRWALVFLLASCLIEMLVPIAWPTWWLEADYFFAISVLFLQIAMSHKWKQKG
jgi:hypothetical protein